jgi:hypothetical protein
MLLLLPPPPPPYTLYFSAPSIHSLPYGEDAAAFRLPRICYYLGQFPDSFSWFVFGRVPGRGLLQLNLISQSRKLFISPHARRTGHVGVVDEFRKPLRGM